jgi:hypothetical protein
MSDTLFGGLEQTQPTPETDPYWFDEEAIDTVHDA